MEDLDLKDLEEDLDLKDLEEDLKDLDLEDNESEEGQTLPFPGEIWEHICWFLDWEGLWSLYIGILKYFHPGVCLQPMLRLLRKRTFKQDQVAWLLAHYWCKKPNRRSLMDIFEYFVSCRKCGCVYSKIEQSYIIQNCPNCPLIYAEGIEDIEDFNNFQVDQYTKLLHYNLHIKKLDFVYLSLVYDWFGGGYGEADKPKGEKIASAQGIVKRFKTLANVYIERKTGNREMMFEHIREGLSRLFNMEKDQILFFLTTRRVLESSREEILGIVVPTLIPT